MTAEQKEAFRRKVKHYSVDHKIDQKEIAKAIGSSEKYFSKVVRGEVNLPLDKMIKLARFMGTTVDDLISV
jgi:transcriptional regulator with XRE-family HTH domain